MPCHLAEQDKMLKNAVETMKKPAARVADLEDKLKNSKAVRERELKQAQTDVDQAKKRYNQSITKTKQKEQVCMWVGLFLNGAIKIVHTLPWPH